nr:hypothetical protein [Pyxidicoccus fallax]
MSCSHKAVETANRHESRGDAKRTEEIRKAAAALAAQRLKEAEARANRRLGDAGAAPDLADAGETSRRDMAAPAMDGGLAANAGDTADSGIAANGGAGGGNRAAGGGLPASGGVPTSHGIAADAGVAANNDVGPDGGISAIAGGTTDSGGAADGGTAVGRSRRQTQAYAEARLEQRVRDLETLTRGDDAGTSLSETIAGLVVEATRIAETSTREHLDEATAEDGDTAADDDEVADADGDTADDDTVADEAVEEDGGTAVAGKTPPSSGDGDAPRKSVRVKLQGEDISLGGKDLSEVGIAFWAALFAALQVAQWVVIALSREYHDVIAREASLLTGVEPEDEAMQPRVHVDFAWIRKKVKRRWRAMLLFVVGVPAMLVLTMPVLCNTHVVSVLSTAWGAYWLVVFTAAKSARAWEATTSPRPPWFLRAWTWLTTKVPGMRWGFLQRYGALWERRTQEVLAPVSTVERHPYAYAGLALIRFLGAFPPMKFFLRPLIPVASAHLLAEETAARAAMKPPPEKPTIPAGETGA